MATRTLKAIAPATSSRRQVLGALAAGLAMPVLTRGGAGAGGAARDAGTDEVPARLQREMYAAALALVKRNVRGGEREPFFKAPFLDAAFSGSIYLWDSCFMAAYAKHHLDVLPIGQALDNFYSLQDGDGWICREYTKEGLPFWPKEHPVSCNPPLLAFAELELHGRSRDLARLKRVYPQLRAHWRYMQGAFRMPDGLHFNDAFGSGMDNIPRYPEGWQDDGQGIVLRDLHPELFVYTGLSPRWNRQGRMVDISAQMALCARQLARIATLVGAQDEVAGYERAHGEIAEALNRLCWHEGDGWYYDLGHGEQVPRRHIGAFWVLWAGIAPPARAQRMLARLTDPAQFWRRIPVASTPADDPRFAPRGAYWLGSVWAPTNYMLLRGLEQAGQQALAQRLARRYYAAVAAVYRDTGTFWENYAPDALSPGSQARADFCGWTALAPIALWHEYIKPGARPA
jgi:hypothetical protein